MRGKAWSLGGVGLLLMLLAWAVSAQEVALGVGGVVVNEAGVPLPGAVVRIQTSSISTHSDTQGRFRLTLPDEGLYHLTAWALGYYNAEPVEVHAGSADVRLVLVAHASEDHVDYAWVSAFASAGDDLNCENCHAAAAESEAYPLPFDEWVQDAHAQSTQNPRFLSMYSGTNLQGQQSQPTRYIYNRDYGRQPLPPDPDQPYYGPGYLLDFPDSVGNCATCHAPLAAVDAPLEASPLGLAGVHQEGITCDFCHKVWDVRLDPVSALPYDNMTGVLSLVLRRPPQGHQFFAGPFDDVAPGKDTYSELQTESAFCAACHRGVFWDTLIYDSYGEWLASPYSDTQSGQTCQDCHMPPGQSAYMALPQVGGLERDSQTLFSHRMPGALDDALLGNAAELTVQAQRSGDELHVVVGVTNSGAGHHLPTDSPLRQVILVVEASAGGVPLVLQSGTVLPDWTGDLAGQAGRYYAKLLEQLWTGEFPASAYWMPVRLREDTRLPALAHDESHYVFVWPRAAGSAEVSVRLVLRRAFTELMTQKSWDTPDQLLELVTLTASE